MSEATIQAALQATLQALPDFQQGSVVVNDWRCLDGSLAGAPYAIIETADLFESRQDTYTAVTTWTVPVTVLVRFTDWSASYDAYRNVRQAIIDGLNAIGEARSPGGGSVTVRVVRSDTPIGEWYDTNQDTPANLSERVPLFVTQRLALEVEEF